MSKTLSCNVQIIPQGNLSNTDGWAWATDNLTSLTVPQAILTNGSAVEQANDWSTLASTIGPSGTWTIDLTSLDNVFGVVSLSKVKIFLFMIDEPDGLLNVNIASDFLDPGNAPSELCTSVYYRENYFNGWDCNVGSTIIVTNPTASAIACSGWIVGVDT